MGPNGKPGLQAFRGTFHKDGSFITARGGEPRFVPETARYFTSDYVANVAAKNGIQINGDVCSATRLLSVVHEWKTGLSLSEAKAHTHLGKTMPTEETIIAFHAARNSVEVEC
jgi:hypothetical protein